MKLIITRNQFEKLKEIFEMYEVDRVFWSEENTSGIGTNISLEFDPKSTIKVDITDVENW